MSGPASYVALSGGIGGAKLSLGLATLLAPPVIPEAEGAARGYPGPRATDRASRRSRLVAAPRRRLAGMTGEEGSDPRLTVIVNTGDDFEHLGLYISPDVDTTLYTLGGVVNPETGWGRRDETWSFMQATAELGGATWFKLGDRDLATHVERTRRLRAGESLTDITVRIAAVLGIAARILPMTDDPVRTVVESDEGTLAFQEYFVRDQCQPAVRRISYEGASTAQATPQVLEALAAQSLAGIIVCPSNPWLSVDPILAVPGMREAIRASGAPVVAVSPIIGGKAVKGPTAKIMTELGIAPDARAIARHYGDLIDGFVLDAEDEALAREIAAATTVTNTLMFSLDDKVALARGCLAFCDRLAKGPRPAARRRTAGAVT